MSETLVTETQQQAAPTPLVVSSSTFGTQITAPVVETPSTETDVSNTSVTTEGTIVETPTTETTVTELPEDEAATFTIPTFEAPSETNTETSNNNQPQAAQTTWQEAIKSADRKEVMKALGLDDADIEFHEFRKSGNDPYKYLEAKFHNWDNVSDVDVIKQDIKSQYPSLSTEEVERLVTRKYSLTSDDEDEKQDGMLLLKTDAHGKRVAFKEEQKKFVIPTVERQQAAVNPQEVEQNRIATQQAQERLDNLNRVITEHDATKSLMDSKKVTVNVGDGVKPFSFPIDSPELLMSVAFGKNWTRAIAANPQEADESKLIPDVAKVQRLAYIAMNPNYEKDLVNYGRSLAKKDLINEGQNAKKPEGSAPNVSGQTIQQAVQNAKQSTFGTPAV